MSRDAIVEAWRRVAVKQGVGLGALAGSRAGEFAVVVAAASLAIPAGAALAERKVNERLRAWLAGPGAMIATDHVELRRWLVDLKLVVRDGYGREYRRVAAPAGYADAVAALASIDVAAIASDAREELARLRAERRAKHEARGEDRR
jgi:hypothetical protein